MPKWIIIWCDVYILVLNTILDNRRMTSAVGACQYSIILINWKYYVGFEKCLTKIFELRATGIGTLIFIKIENIYFFILHTFRMININQKSTYILC